MIRLTRYSPTGFAPVYQKVMVRQISYILTTTEEEINKLEITDFAKNLIWQTLLRDRISLDPNFELNGIHVFLTERLTHRNRRLFLNHLDPKIAVSVHYGRISESATGYGLHSPYLQDRKSLLELYGTGHIGAFIPASQLGSIEEI